MRKSLLMLALVIPAMAGDITAPLAQVEQPAQPSPWAVEIAGVHTWTMADADDWHHNINTMGIDITAIYNINTHWAATLRFSWAYGSGRYAEIDGPDEYFREKSEITNWAISGGVRYTAPLFGKLSWFTGANVGWGRTEMTAINEEMGGEDGYRYIKGSADDVGLSYSAEIGLKYDLTTNLYITGSAGVRGVWTTPNWPSGYRSDQQFGTSAGIGLGWAF